MATIDSELNPLGKSSVYKDEYDASLLFAIPRAEGRSRLVGGDFVPVYGEDIWNAYELSWLNAKGKPVVAMGEFRIPATGANLIESKSFKLYLNSYNQTRFDSPADVQARMAADLSAAAGCAVTVELTALPDVLDFGTAPTALCVDDLDVTITAYQPDGTLLATADGEFDGWLCSHLLKSNCPVTGQPDWGSVYVYYRGPVIVPESFLAYVVSMRQHQGFHEQCVEQIFQDINRFCHPESLIVCARYVRRGGLDINPVRSSLEGVSLENFRTVRQ
ncbi:MULTISPECIES: NADPH-dependent 7-cyano-7-deazaguanine reductase QueF [unclassified Oceanobacter]|uniref:NADPH-dependent 7-cyano-7-deazaguanine reductase QueF n=1 Tax=unclassified Oceanobacter TaxID=2620260 RepID=UPI002735EEFC|nr:MULTISPECIES: NADPH-dependent 7-cyano-7-deazaguanine reductase QueF [unclassified Oceanobacter]MDP2610188.1 NADPH-dependent 7-cyano-7-deazaguanine reductase QueF [Oceanobacter sp. 1_MG-2023]MDP2613454.1 NADPH-dependent 7-cyano-7-deazaguanine reductase QueF [Oceanobacter sp. 2_MG-2023]